MTKGEFLEELTTTRERLHLQLRQLGDERLSQRPSLQEWSVKDAVAHLTYWEQFAIGNIRRALADGSAPQWMDDAQETAKNAQLLEQSGATGADELLGEMERSYQELVSLVQSLSEADLLDPGRFSWLDGRALWQYIEEEGYGGHHREHLSSHLSW